MIVRCLSVKGSRFAFTLIEMLAVIVLVSMVASVASIGLAGSNDSARLRATAAQLQDLDARARTLARHSGPVMMGVNQDRHEIVLQAAHSAEIGTTITLPAGTVVQMRTERPSDMITFDRLGRSVDYSVELHGASHVIRWNVSGLTGLVRSLKP